MSIGSRRRKDEAREMEVRAATTCPACGSGIGQPCRAGTSPHDSRRGQADLRPVLGRVHSERRALWVRMRG